MPGLRDGLRLRAREQSGRIANETEVEVALGKVVSVEPDTVSATKLAETLVSSFGPTIAGKVCERELFLASVECKPGAQPYWTRVGDELARLGVKTQSASPSGDDTATKEGLVLNRIFVRINTDETRQALIAHAVQLLRQEPLED